MIRHLTKRRDASAPTFSERYLARIYALPNPYKTREDFDRFYHLDLPSLSDEELGRDFRLAQQRADYETDEAAAAWLAARLDAIRQELARRTPTRPRERDTGQRRPVQAGIRVGGTVVELPRGGRSHGRG